ncbi:MAG TPA: aminotransferase class V-fold PLP-dependent enzyme, partial [Enhygromyxa sp.]|nr:aminotransferase class V-fold PLP-dependent enzyme [Enhygromyxa sp.]
ELEHHSNDLPHRKRGPILRCRVSHDGSLDMNHLRELLTRNEVKLVAVTGASNVTGWISDIHGIARLAHEYGARVLLDCAQLLAHLPIDVKAADDPEHIDFLAAAGHKAYAPFGASFLYGPRSLMDNAPPYLPGGGTASRVSKTDADYVKSPDRHQGGTPNIGGVIAFAEAIRFLDTIGMERIREHELALTQRAFDGLLGLGGVTIYGPQDPAARLGVLSFNVEGISDQLAAAVLSEEHAIAVRNGRFCAHVYVDRLLAAQGGYTTEPGATPGAVRGSFGLFNDNEDVDRFVAGVKALRDRDWVGRYRMQRGEGISAEFAGRCNDTWMEAEAATSTGPESHSPTGLPFEFSQLNPAGPCKCYLVADKATRKAMIVDPRRDFVELYVSVIEKRGLELVYTVETHTHADHLSGSKRLKELTGCKMAMHHSAVAPCVDELLYEGNILVVGELNVHVWAMPGHTLDSIALLLPDRILTGDTVLLGATGRTDLGGDAGLAFRSLQRMHSLPGEMELWPGHDYKGRTHSTVAEQLETNPRLQIDDESEFCRLMDSLDLPTPDAHESAIAANEGCL